MNTQTLQPVTHPSLERLPGAVSIAHVSKYPENNNAGLEPIHSSLGEYLEGWGGGMQGWRRED